MADWPEFVQEIADQTERPPNRALSGQAIRRTGWETVVFEVEDDQGFDDSTAAIAP
jgi:hypothetical protein